MDKVCVFFATGFEEIEALTAVDLLRRAGIGTELVSITGEMEVMGSHGIAVKMDKLFEDVDFSEVTMLILPGGAGTKHLEAHMSLMNQVDIFYKEGKDIAAICAAPSILGHRGMLKGKNACSFPDYESHLEGANVTKNPVEIADNIITSRGMGCSIDFGLAIVKKLRGEDTAKALADKIVYGHY
ncbi:DJ-1 family glyoxalase III [Kineothrix sedimenti]|uniref:DJ-1 family glyoxalase III n=1 Tax=Kineothrix sedimenti TaxID=3123317 RepID=A0ABZ3F1F8_9FIRM